MPWLTTRPSLISMIRWATAAASGLCVIIAIARALINAPAIVLADEPTGNLDSLNSTMILNLFRDLNQRAGQTIMMITHNHEAAAVGHRIIEMRDGRVVSHGIVPHLVTGAGT